MKEKLFKKGLKKRLSSVVLALVMIFSLLPMNSMKVYAASEPVLVETITAVEEGYGSGIEGTEFGVYSSDFRGKVNVPGTDLYAWYINDYLGNRVTIKVKRLTGSKDITKLVLHLAQPCNPSTTNIGAGYTVSPVVSFNDDYTEITVTDFVFKDGAASILNRTETMIYVHSVDIYYTPHICSESEVTESNKKAGQAATCTADGWNAYWKCSCGKVYATNDFSKSYDNENAWKTGDGKIAALGHDWEYTADGAALTATCLTSSCGETATVTLSANSTNYSGSAATITIGTAAEKEAWRTAGLTVPTTISYEKADGTSLASAPTSVGSYVAKVSPDGVTASTANTARVSFTIEQAHGTDTTKWKYDSTNHWHPCFRSDCSEHKGGIATHNYVESTHKCECGKANPDASIHTYGAWSVTKLATATANGEREHACSVCGFKETEATSYEKNVDDPTIDPNAGKIANKTDATKNSCDADVELTKAEIIKTFGLTAEELSKVENGVDISVKLEVAAVESKNVLASDKNVAEKKLDSDEKIGQYLDINLFKIVGDDKSKVTQLNGKIKIEITLPSDVKNAGTDYFIIRVHDGVATKLELTHVSGDTYTFETDQFSTYALGYKTDDNKGKAPKTGDDNSVYDWMLLMIAGFGVMGASFFLKRKEEN